jgi:hypothetical protein
MDRRPRLVVVHGSGQILNRVCNDIMQYSQRLLDVLGNQGQWNLAAIKSQLNQMLSMIKEHHACFDGVWFSEFVRMGQGDQLDMVTTRKVRTVSNGGRDSNCLMQLTFNSRCCLTQASMEALKRFEANRSAWMAVISSAHNLLTRRDLERFADLCNDGHKPVEGENYLYKHWQSLFLGCPTYIWIRNGVKGHKDVEESNNKGSNNESWGGSIKSTGGGEYFLAYHQWITYFEWLQFCLEEAARYRQFEVRAYVFLSLLPCVNQ